MYHSPVDMGMLDPSTSDGRVIFFLPWQGATIAGTTGNTLPSQYSFFSRLHFHNIDTPTDLTHYPEPSEQEINFILNEVKHYLSPGTYVVLLCDCGVLCFVVQLSGTSAYYYFLSPLPSLFF